MKDSTKTIEAGTVLYRPEYSRIEGDRNGTPVLLDAEGPNWLGTDARGMEILDLFDGTRTFGGVVREYSAGNRDMEL
ncbi:MAG: hypothetical protein V3W51_06995, partial [Candidatus Brocadiales bacterium]